MTHKLSKRAFSIGDISNIGDVKNLSKEDAIKYYWKTIWSPSKGFFENLFNLSMYAAPFFGIGGILAAGLSYLGSYLLGVGPVELGAALDKVIGTGPGKVPSEDDIPRMGKILAKAVKEKFTANAQAISQKQIVKEASVFSALKAIPGVLNGLKKLIMGLFGVFAVANLDDFFKEITSPIREVATGKPEGFMGEKQAPTTTAPAKKENLDDLLNRLERQMDD